MQNVFPKRYQKAKIARITHTASSFNSIPTYLQSKKAAQKPFKQAPR
jgi:hypothetical protein